MTGPAWSWDDAGVPARNGPHEDDLDVDGDAARIPFVDLAADHRGLEDEIAHAWSTILKGSGFIGGEVVRRFETDLSDYLGAKHVVGVANGTDAIMLALRGLGIREGDEVITAANTFVATVEAIIHAGGRPVLVDVDEGSATLDPEKVEAAVTERTRFIVPVHLYGQACDMGPLMSIAADHDLKVVEDNAQAIGATYRGKKTGTIGHASATSFYPSKNLGAAGDGGAVITDDVDCATLVRSLANHGKSESQDHHVLGYNSRLDALQAAILSVKLPHLDAWNASRRRIAGRYEQVLAHIDLQLPVERAPDEHVYHLYVVRHRARDALARALNDLQIGTGFHYASPIHLMRPYRDLGEGLGSFPVAESWARELVSLPMYPSLTDLDVELVGTRVEHALRGIDVRANSPV
jgi:dTDP-4-amino-4,6-dideoxygalactose transaminase